MNGTKTLTEWTINTILIILVLFAAFVLVTTTLLGWKLNPVMSGSMDPVLKAGGVIASRAVDPETIEVGDIITHKSPDIGVVLVHRVIEKEDDDELLFRTKGDANENPDPYLVPAENVVGKVSFYIPFLGRVHQIVDSGGGLLLMVTVPGLIIMTKGIQNIRAEIPRLRNTGQETGALRLEKDV